MRLWALAIACMLAGCVPAENDGFHARVAGGCRAVDDCNALVQEADARMRTCMRDHVGLGQCESEVNDRRAAGRLADAAERAAASQRARAHAEAYRSQLEQSRAEQAHRQQARAQAELQQHEQDCASDRDQRRARFQQHEAWMVQRNTLVDWMNAHCIIEDTGHDEVRDFVGPDGVVTRRMVHTGTPERKCHGHPPESLPPASDDYAGEPFIPYDERAKDRDCDDVR